MKLLKKLMPILTATTVSMAALPIVASCGSSGKEWKPGEEYKPSTEQISGEYTLEDAETKYFADATDNKNVLLDDAMVAMSSIAEAFGATKVSCSIDSVNSTDKTFSGSCEITAKWEGDTTKSFSLNIKNFPLNVVHNGSNFCVQAKKERLLKETGWSIVVKADKEMMKYLTGEDNITTYTLNSKETWIKNMGAYTISTYIIIPSYHMYKCTLKQDITSWVDLLQTYVHKVSQTSGEYPTISGGANQYFKDVQVNPLIFADDIFYTLNTMAPTTGANVFKARINGLQADYKCMSFTIEIVMASEDGKTNVTEKAVFKNVPFEMEKKTQGWLFCCESNDTTTPCSSWGENASLEVTTTGQTEAGGTSYVYNGRTVTLNKDSISTEISTDIDGVNALSLLNSVYVSWYFEKVKVTE